MKYGKTLWALAALNAALLLGLVWKLGGETAAHAQVVRARAEIALVPAEVKMFPNGVVLVIDSQNGILGGFTYDQNARALVPMQPMDLNRLFMAAMGGGQ